MAARYFSKTLVFITSDLTKFDENTKAHTLSIKMPIGLCIAMGCVVSGNATATHVISLRDEPVKLFTPVQEESVASITNVMIDVICME
jgi:hypothetical protein